MQRIILFFISFLFAFSSFSQVMKDERVTYLWDVTLSMYGWSNDASKPEKQISALNKKFPHYDEQYDIYAKVVEAMVNDINAITNERTEIVVIPFQDKRCAEWNVKATPEGKKEIIEKIKKYRNDNVTHTNISEPLEYLMNSVFTPDKLDVLKLMTDGSDNVNPQKLHNILNSWCSMAESKEVYGYYILLTDKASDGEVKMWLEQNKCFTVIDGPKVVFTQISLPKNVKYNIKDDADKPIRLKVAVNDGASLPVGQTIKLSAEQNDWVNIDVTVGVLSDGYVEFTPQMKKSVDELKNMLPKDANTIVNVSLAIEKTNEENMVVLRNQSLQLELVNKPEKTMKFYVK